MPESRISLIIPALLLIACACIYGAILVPYTTFAGMDFLNLNYPRVWLIREAIAAGHLPLWNWYEWGGAPLLAALQGAAFYPPTWIAMALPLPYGLQVFVFAHLYLAGLGAYLLGKRVAGLTPPFAVFAAIAYMGSGFFPGRIEQFQIVAVNCLLPWLILLTRSVALGRLNPAWLTLLWAGNILAGHPQYAVLNVLTAGLFLLLLDGKTLLQWRPLARLAGAFAIGTGLSMMQILPTWELSQLSERIWPYSDPTTPELAWSHLPALIIPKYYHWITGEPGRILGFTELGLYCGILTAPLAIIALGLATRPGFLQRRFIAVCATVWLLAMIFALGKHAGLAPLFFDYVPFFKQTRGAARSLNIASLMLCLMAATGLMCLLNRLTSQTAPRSMTRLSAEKLALALCLLLCADLTVNHRAALTGVLVPVRSLAGRPFISSDSTPYPGNLYRFMSHDSDIFLNNTAAAVRERLVRVQPNLNSVHAIALLDGYEEGLLPTRNHANSHRLFNRNLRNDSPDATLLAFMRSNAMLTEFPLPESGNHWYPVGPPQERPPIVPSVIPGNPAAYRLWRSSYNVAAALDFNKLIAPADQAEFLRNTAAVFPPDLRQRAPAHQIWTPHPLEAITPQQFNAANIAKAPPPDKGFLWNRLALDLPQGTTRSLVLIPPYPGWKTETIEGMLKIENSLFFLLEMDNGMNDEYHFNLVYRPFSFQVGLFISLFSMVATIIMMIKIRHRRTDLKTGRSPIQ